MNCLSRRGGFVATSKVAPNLLSNLLSRVAEARAQTDALFELLPPNSFYERPIAERHRLIFYLGHLEAFDWNLFSGALELGTHDATFAKLFAFGIDPIGGGLPTDKPGDWPNIARTEKYKSNIRARLDQAMQKSDGSRDALLAGGTLLNVAIEHRLMHAETLAYLLHNLPLERKIPHPAAHCDPSPAPRQRQVTFPA